jgi:hypothetical protein
MIVGVMVAETWLVAVFVLLVGGVGGSGLEYGSMVRLVRLLRLSRMARMARLLRLFPELMILVKGLSVALRSVFFTLCLLVAIMYIFAVGFTQLTKDTDIGFTYFSTVLNSMNTLFLQGTLPDHAAIVNDLGKEGLGYRFVILCYILLAGLVIMNMLVGVLVEVVSVVASVEKEALLVTYVRTRLQEFLKEEGNVSKIEFNAVLQNPNAARALQEVHVDVVGLVDLEDHIFAGQDEVSFADMMDAVLQLRGTNNATVKDIVDLRKRMLAEFSRLHTACTGSSTPTS